MNHKQYHRIVLIVMLVGLVLGPFVINAIGPTSAGNEDLTPINLTLIEQIVITAAAFVVKPLYQIISLAIVILLWKRTDPDLAAIRRAMLAFFIGENACALNYLVFHEGSLLLEFIHTYGMVVCFGLVVYALMEAFDNRVFNFSQGEKKCVLLPLCGRCYKYSEVRCNLRYIFLMVVPVTAAIALVPLTASLGNKLYAGNVFGNAVVFGHPLLYQFLEVRLYPWASLPFFALSFLLLLLSKESGFGASKIFYAMGVGLLGFSLMRFFFYWGYQKNPLWADRWEEITEFLFIAVVFWIVLRVRAVSQQLEPKRGYSSAGS
ncbi:MAG TPA: hypothetical protein DCO77_04905 [Nitrospiraceae bacterium]|nr:hypothetical protein [Nitrospiraceae bacterium]